MVLNVIRVITKIDISGEGLMPLKIIMEVNTEKNTILL